VEGRDMAESKDGRTLKNVTASMTQDGRFICFTLEREDASKHEIVVPFSDLATLSLLIEQQSKISIERQELALGGTDRRSFWPMSAKRVTRLRGAKTSSGDPLLTIELSGGIALDLAFEGTDIPALIEWLENFQKPSQPPKSPPSRH
jgi:hypothetical protein